jgi:hypothetical protein
MQKICFTCIIFLAMSVVFLSCSGKYNDVIEVNEDFMDATTEYIDSLDKADSAASVASALDEYADRMETLAPRMKKMAEKYPELKDPDKIPEALKKSTEKVEAMGIKMAGSMMKSMQYMMDSKVREAQMRFQKAMSLMMTK